MNYSCIACGSSRYKEKLNVKAFLFDINEKYEYLVCANCNSIQLGDILLDASHYYVNSSYSSFVAFKGNSIKQFFINIRNTYYYLGRVSLLSFILSKIYPIDRAHQLFSKFSQKTKDIKILDIGCGNGMFLLDLLNIGFKNLRGIDPYIENKFSAKNILIDSTSIENLEGKFDLIRLHHSFEHVNNPLELLISIKNKLNFGGVCLITIPICDLVTSEFKECAYILQAPHHICIYTIKGISILCERSGLNLTEVVRDAAGISKWLAFSELWKESITEKNNSLEFNFKYKKYKEKYLKIEKKLIDSKLGDNVTFIINL